MRNRQQQLVSAAAFETGLTPSAEIGCMYAYVYVEPFSRGAPSPDCNCSAAQMSASHGLFLLSCSVFSLEEEEAREMSSVGGVLFESFMYVCAGWPQIFPGRPSVPLFSDVGWSHGSHSTTGAERGEGGSVIVLSS